MKDDCKVFSKENLEQMNDQVDNMVVMDAKLSDQSKAKLSRATLRSVASSIESRSELQLKVDGKKA